MQLENNNKEHKELISNSIKRGNFPRAIFTWGVFTSSLASSLTKVSSEGYITFIDDDSNYVNWKTLKDENMLSLTLNCIKLI
jgi:hypothetical protein